MPWQDKKGIWRDYYGGMHQNEGAAIAAETSKKQKYFNPKKKHNSIHKKKAKAKSFPTRWELILNEAKSLSEHERGVYLKSVLPKKTTK